MPPSSSRSWTPAFLRPWMEDGSGVSGRGDWVPDSNPCLMSVSTRWWLPEKEGVLRTNTRAETRPPTSWPTAQSPFQSSLSYKNKRQRKRLLQRCATRYSSGRSGLKIPITAQVSVQRGTCQTRHSETGAGNTRAKGKGCFFQEGPRGFGARSRGD